MNLTLAYNHYSLDNLEKFFVVLEHLNLVQISGGGPTSPEELAKGRVKSHT